MYFRRLRFKDDFSKHPENLIRIRTIKDFADWNSPESFRYLGVSFLVLLEGSWLQHFVSDMLSLLIVKHFEIVRDILPFLFSSLVCSKANALKF